MIKLYSQMHRICHSIYVIGRMDNLIGIIYDLCLSVLNIHISCLKHLSNVNGSGELSEAWNSPGWPQGTWGKNPSFGEQLLWLPTTCMRPRVGKHRSGTHRTRVYKIQGTQLSRKNVWGHTLSWHQKGSSTVRDNTLQRNSDLWTPRKGTARPSVPISTFMYL